MKKFIQEFKKFITRGNVLDMSVGVIIGGAFTGIVNGLSNYILKPLINYLFALIFGESALDGAITVLPGVTDASGNVVYIDWGAFISTILNFLLIAVVLFVIIKFFNKVHEEYNDMLKEAKEMTSKEVIELRKQGKKRREIKKILKERKLEAEAKAKLAEEEAKKNAPPTTNELLEQILQELKNK